MSMCGGCAKGAKRNLIRHANSPLVCHIRFLPVLVEMTWGCSVCSVEERTGGLVASYFNSLFNNELTREKLYRLTKISLWRIFAADFKIKDLGICVFFALTVIHGALTVLFSGAILKLIACLQKKQSHIKSLFNHLTEQSMKKIILEIVVHIGVVLCLNSLEHYLITNGAESESNAAG